MTTYQAASPETGRYLRPVQKPARPLRVALVSEGCYPFYPGGVSLFCHQLISGMPENSFTSVSLTVDGSERPSWPAQDNLTEVLNVPLWGPDPRRRWGQRIPASFATGYESFLRCLLMPLGRDSEAASGAHFIAALRELYESAQAGCLPSAMTRNNSLDLLRQIWHEAGLESGQLGAAGPLSLRDAMAATSRLEHLLRPLACPPIQADVCHLTMNGITALIGLSAKWSYGTPMLMSEHGIYLRERYLGLASEAVTQPIKVITMRFQRRLAAGAYHVTDTLAPHSAYNRRWQLYGGADPGRVQTMYNGIDPNDFPIVPGEPEEPTIVFVGRIDPLKDLHTLIRAFEIVRRRMPRARLRIFGPVPEGNEEYRDSCAQLVGQLGLADAATFEGRIPRQADGYAAGHLVALTSVSEGFPYTVVESMSMGRPQVCTNVGGVPEAVGDAGFVVPPRDHEAVADACVQLLSDPGLRAELGRRARQRVIERFTLDQWTNAYRAIYADLAAGSGPIGSAPARIGNITSVSTPYALIARNLRDDEGAPEDLVPGPRAGDRRGSPPERGARVVPAARHAKPPARRTR